MNPPDSIAHYKVTGKLGEGGMGAVYRATDTRLNREVAIKVLPAAWAEDAMRMTRFDREAQVLASLNHPNIAGIYGIEQGAIVMELVEGRDLKGPEPLETAVEYGKQIAAALEAAHEKGITHRDLKPANIRVTPEGRIKVLDFGLAKAGGSDASTAGAENSPTLTIRATQTGMILGTAAYMSPEQAKGKSLDRRADIWAFGVVMCELLTGRTVFAGENVSEILAAVILKDPDWNGVPAAIRPVLEKCLRKDPRLRWQWIGDVRLALDECTAPAAPVSPVRQSRRRPWIAALAGASVLGVGGTWALKPAPDAPLMQFEINPPDGVSLGPPNFSQYAVAPDGRSVLFVGRGVGGKLKLWRRRFDAAAAVAVDGTDGAMFPAWSLDGRSISFIAEGKLNVMEPGGGPARVLGDALGTNTWGAGDAIVTTHQDGLMKYQASGGAPVRVVDPESDEERQAVPAFFPDGRKLIYTSAGSKKGGLRIVHADGKPGEPLNEPGVRPAAIVVDGTGQYWLMGNSGDQLRVRRFDVARETMVGPSIPIVSGVPPGPIWSASNTGVLVFRRAQKQTHRLLLRSADGKSSRELIDIALNGTLRISPDGKRAAFLREYGNDRGIWMLEIAAGAVTRLTLGRDDTSPVWSPEGDKLYYSASRGSSQYAVVERSADGAGVERTILSDRRRYYPAGISPDGRYLLLNAAAGGTSSTFAVPVAGGQPARILGDVAPNPSFSPDGRWVIYELRRRMGMTDVMASAVPAEAGGTGRAATFQISKTGGLQPVWRGKNIFYIAPDGKMMKVPVDAGEALRVGTPEALFDTGIRLDVNSGPRQYDVSPDEKWILFREDANIGNEPPLTVVLNWQKLMR